MAWSDLADNQMVSFNDAQSSGASLKAGQSHVNSDKCMTRLEIVTKYNVELSDVLFADNQLCTKFSWGIYGSNSSFSSLNQNIPYMILYGMGADPNGDVYAVSSTGQIYQQTGGTGNFSLLSHYSNRFWSGITFTSNGDAYTCDTFQGYIYKRTGRTGNFVAVSNSFGNWYGIAAAPNGNIYACRPQGDIYKQTGGTGNFVALNQTYRAWSGMAASSNGDIYACVENGDIYKQTGGTGNFVALNQTSRLWSDITVAPNGDIYACVESGDIYKQTGGTGNFVALNETLRYWQGITAAPNGNIYACAGGEIYMLPAPLFYNTQQSATAARNNCPSGYIAGDATLTVAANTYSSSFSVAVANQLALDYIYDNLQAYANANGSCTYIYYNTQQSGTATRNNCSEGYEGSTETLIAQAGTFTSTIGVQNANDKAIAYIELNAQSYANANGTCTLIPVYYNTQQQLTLAKNNCPEGYSGSDVTLTVAANTYSSNVSVAVANQLAIDYLYDNAQAYANANGTCTLNTPADNITAYITFAPTGGSCTINKNGIRQIRTTNSITSTFSAAPGDEISITIVSPLGSGRTAIIDVYNNGYVGGNTGTISTTFTFTVVAGSGTYEIFADAYNQN
jgi:hypothetical protein